MYTHLCRHRLHPHPLRQHQVAALGDFTAEESTRWGEKELGELHIEWQGEVGVCGGATWLGGERLLGS